MASPLQTATIRGVEAQRATTHAGSDRGQAVRARALRRPSAVLLALEGRAGLEFAAMVPLLPLLERLPRGDGHPVLVLPGLLASDFSTRTLRWFLRRRGYHVHGWRLGRNLGPSPELAAGLGRRFADLRERHGRRISIVGQSLGGIFARELARRFAGDVRQVVTLGSPLRDPLASYAYDLFRRSGVAGAATGAPLADRRLAAPIDVPTTSIYSRSDGIVAWQSCLEEEGPQRQNVEIFSSHVGMAHHPAALLVIADRLAQPEDRWKPYVPNAWSRWAFRLTERAA